LIHNRRNNDNISTTGKPEPIITWTDQLATGLDDVDAQHRKLLDMINTLGSLQAGEAASDNVIAVYEDLKNYTIYHFQHEEELMNAWPMEETGKAAHIKTHQGFIERITKIDEMIPIYPSYVVDHLLAFLVKWLTHHILDVDSRMAAEITALRSGELHAFTGKDRRNKDVLSNSISELYDSIGIRSLEILDLNIQLESEIERRKQVEDEALLASLVFDNSSQAMTVTDDAENIIAVNPAFTRLTGYQLDEVIGKNPNILGSGKHDRAFYQKMRESLNDTGHWDGELWNRHKNGEIFAESLTINTIYHKDGSVDRRVSVFSDITEKKHDQEKLVLQATELKEMVIKEATLNASLSQEIAVKDRLFSIISHDLRSPFTLLMGMTQRMVARADTYSREKLIEKVEVLNRTSKGIYHAVEDLLEWSSKQQDGDEINKQHMVLSDIVEDTLRAIQPVATDKDIGLVNKIAHEKVFTDPDMFKTILRNLVNNSIKFSKYGSDVVITAISKGKRVEIIVSDSGVGLPQSIIDNIFRIDKKTTTPGTAGEKGSGLGLPLCADLAKDLGGKIRVESPPGEFTRFIVNLPATPDN
jgi:hemerythrin-like metal-binding protein/PAS domain S-box-containing protein